MQAMMTSAARASLAMQEIGVNACTDVTGFGLLGHAYEMAKGSGVCLEIEAAKVPLLPDVVDLIAQRMLTRGDQSNRAYVGDTITFSEDVTNVMQSALYDPQTAGGLLISLPAKAAEQFLQKLNGAKIIGQVAATTPGKWLRVI
jgi:selenide,water dikinase